MHGMLAAETTILVHLDAIRSILLVLHRVVVSLLAFVASQGDFLSCACSHFFGTSLLNLTFYGVMPPCSGIRFFAAKPESSAYPFVCPKGYKKTLETDNFAHEKQPVFRQVMILYHIQIQRSRIFPDFSMVFWTFRLEIKVLRSWRGDAILYLVIFE